MQKNLTQVTSTVKPTPAQVWKELRYDILTALEQEGHGVLEALDVWDTEFKPAIISAPPGDHTFQIGEHTITFSVR